MSKDIILHNIRDWSKIDERESFWGKVDLLTPNTNFGIHRYSSYGPAAKSALEGSLTGRVCLSRTMARIMSLLSPPAMT